MFPDRTAIFILSPISLNKKPNRTTKNIDICTKVDKLHKINAIKLFLKLNDLSHFFLLLFCLRLLAYFFRSIPSVIFIMMIKIRVIKSLNT